MSDRYELEPGANDDRTVPAICYGLYLFGLTNGLTIIIGLVVAYAHIAKAGPATRSHYQFLIRTVWLAIAWLIVGGLLTLFGGLLSITIIGLPLGLPMLGLAWIIFSVELVWFLLRMVVGLVYLARGEPHPRPRTWYF